MYTDDIDFRVNNGTVAFTSRVKRTVLSFLISGSVAWGGCSAFASQPNTECKSEYEALNSTSLITVIYEIFGVDQSLEKKTVESAIVQIDKKYIRLSDADDVFRNEINRRSGCDNHQRQIPQSSSARLFEVSEQPREENSRIIQTEFRSHPQ